MSALTVALVQSVLHWHDPARNLERFSKMLQAHPDPADLFVLPEMFSTGFTMDATTNAEPMDGRSVTWMAEISGRLGAAVCGSLIIEEDGHYFNRFILMHPDGNFACYDKRHRFRLAGEHEHFSAGNKIVTIELKGWRIRPMVCYDLRFPVWSRNRDGYDLLVYVANWPDRRHLAWKTLIRARAIENLAYVAAVNRIGTDGNGIDYLGGSAIIDYLGTDMLSMADKPAVMAATLEKAPLETFREKFPFHLDADAFTITGQKAS
ncbi:MAG TPA: amidohydrolase [Woeseiaceae bacterium]|nr:amidohydrolase [Woeseiaceae bacterium]